ncbi:DUF5986 family protein [Christensenella tenuis]|uniref:Uncharacterized protein n=1 Tax=Christensenella tenuis TaxID=2763033 RepID=A0ABR7EF99_9FIRM|nr:DUF5986 family protein [Christensenella tenuis]MBC5647848.1 hypothetical protein [Christensenella tenuis]
MILLREEYKRAFVEAIDSGLQRSSDRLASENKRYNNAANFAKLDDIYDAVARVLEACSHTRVVTLRRGGYKLPLVYDEKTRVLISVMNESKFKDLLSEYGNGHFHYLQGIAGYNDIDEGKQIVWEECITPPDDEVAAIKEQVEVLLGGETPQSYVTIVFLMHGLEIIGAKAVLVSKYMKIIEIEDLSHYIEVHYQTFEPIDEVEEDDGIDIKLKKFVFMFDDEEDIPVDEKDKKRQLGKDAIE